MKFTIHHLPVTESTNLDARAGSAGDVFTADEQTSGRGRLNHKWLSQPGSNLMMSVVLDVAGSSPECVSTLPLVVGLAVHGAVLRLCSAAADSRIMLKWPNDVLAGHRKIAGILCELCGDKVIAGVGVNVNQVIFAPEIAARATSLAREGCEASVVGVRDAVLNELDALYAVWREGGFAALHSRYSAVDLLKGRMVSVRQTDCDDSPLTGFCGGVQPDGTLLVAGQSVFAGEAHIESFLSDGETAETLK